MNLYVWSVILGGCIVTVLPRVLPITVLSKVKLNKTIEDFLTYIPISILAALIAAELLTTNNKISIMGNSLELLAAIPTVLVAVKKNELLLTVIVGVIAIAVLRFAF